jgi:hypothetical protein
MTELRRPRPTASRTTGQPLGVMPQPARPLANGATCDGCRWAPRCAKDGLCWTAEKAAIAAERANG